MFSIVTVNYNNAQLLIECISKTLALMSSLSYEIIIVDNCSTDDSFDILASYFAESEIIRVIRTDYNGGFGYGCNYGAKFTTSNVLWFLNSDAWVVSIESLDEVLLLLEEPRAGMIGTSVTLEDGYIASQGGVRLTFLYLVLSSFRVGRLYRSLPCSIRNVFNKVLKRVSGPLGQYANSLDNRNNRSLHPTDSVGGGTFLIRKATYEYIAGFDERFFLYDEDSDLCQRLAGAKFVHYMAPKLLTGMFLSATTRKLDSLYLKRIKYQSRKLLIKKHFSGMEKMTLLLITYCTWRLL